MSRAARAEKALEAEYGKSHLTQMVNRMQKVKAENRVALALDFKTTK